MAAAIHIQNLNKSYKGVRALHNISFDVQEGELFGLIGPDGAGKTSLLRILATLLKPDTGLATLAGYHIVDGYKQIRKCIGYMPGRFSLYQDLSVEENLEFFATIFGTTITANYELIKDIYIQIEPFKTRLAGRLSGGMKQKLALCCALIHKPRVLILDEPTTGVDAVSRREFWEMLIRLKAHGISIIVSTPYMDEASLCNRVALIQKGHIMQLDSPAAIIEGFGHLLLAVKSTNMYQLLRDLQAYNHTHSVYPFGEYLHFAPKQTEGATEALMGYLTQRDHSGVECQPIKANIEDVFMELMTKQSHTVY